MRNGEKPPQPGFPRVLAGLLASGLLLAVAACSPDAEDAQEVPHHSYVSRPDLKPAQVDITRGEGWTSAYEDADEYIFWTPNYGSETPSSGAKIFDLEGEPVWVAPDDPDDAEDNYFDLRIQQYRGEPVLTYYQGPSEGGWGFGDIFILDESYQQIAQVTTAGDLEAGSADFHDTTITEDDTMFVGAYVPAQADLSEVDGPADGWVEEAVIQEIDIASGEVVFEWSSLDHVPVAHARNDFDDKQDELDEEAEEDDEEPAQLGTEEEPFDYFHLNSMTEDHDGSILVSARHTHAVYKLDRDTGELEWTLGGTGSDFEMDDDAVFAWQHDAQRADDGTLTLFDNHANGSLDDDTSRGLRLSLDEEAMTASLVTEYAPPDDRSAGSMANAHPLPDGNMLIGWGSEPHYSEYTNDGELVYDVCHGAGCYGDDFHGGGGSYRAYKAPWQGQPETEPDVVLEEETGERLAYVSWNGATEVAQWRLLAGQDEASAEAHTTVDRESFETAVPVPEDAQHITVEALDEDGEVLAAASPDQ